MATKTQIEDQLLSLGCPHKLQHLRAAAFILLHINPAAFNRLEMRGEARISDVRKKTPAELVAALDPLLWVDMAKTVCDRIGKDIHAAAGDSLRAFMDVFPKHVPTWVPVAIFLLLAIPREAGAVGEALRRRAMESVKLRIKEEGVRRVRDSVRHAALEIYTSPKPAEIAKAYVVVFQASYK